jgi:hypothetical protein
MPNGTAVVDALLKEWEQNVALYIDADQRGFQRIAMFLVLNGALLVFFTELFKQVAGDFAVLLVALVVTALALAYVVITCIMSNRAHAFILLRKAQGMLIEKKLRDLLAPGQPWATASGIITTFTREHVAFRECEDVQTENREWLTLMTEVKDYSCRLARPLCPCWRRSIGHLKWLSLMYWGLGFLWLALAVCIIIKYMFPAQGLATP